MKESIFLWYIMVCITYGKYYTTNIFMWHWCFKTCFRTGCLLSNYYKFKRNVLCCDGAWKHPVYIINQTKCTANIFVWRSCLKAWFHADCHHSNHQMLNLNLFFVSWPRLKIFSSVYYQPQVHRKYFYLTVRLDKIIPWRLLVIAMYTCTSIIHLSEKKVFFSWLVLKAFCSFYYQTNQFNGQA